MHAHLTILAPLMALKNILKNSTCTLRIPAEFTWCSAVPISSKKLVKNVTCWDWSLRVLGQSIKNCKQGCKGVGAWGGKKKPREVKIKDIRWAGDRCKIEPLNRGEKSMNCMLALKISFY